MSLPRDERESWEDAGASFDSQSSELVVDHGAVAFSDLLARSVEAESAVARLLGVDRAHIRKLVQDNSLYAFAYGDSRFFPAWQFLEGGTLPGLRQVLAALDEGLHPLVVDHLFTTPSLDLEISGAPVPPATWLSMGGNPGAVVELASDL